VQKNLLKLILVLVVISFVAVPYVILAPERAREKAEEERLFKEEIARTTAEKKTYLLGKFDPSVWPDFVQIPFEYTVARTKMYLRKETYASYEKMRNEALKSDIILNIASAARNFDYQKMLWNNKWNGITLVEGQKLPEIFPDELERFRKILEYSAAPGTSRHHWGTDIDINGADSIYFDSEKGQKEYAWLHQNAWKFGFCQTYDQKGPNRASGYNEEKWHWSYLPLSVNFTEEYKNLIKEEDIKGFLGEEYVPSFNLINNYVLSINPDCV